MSPEQLILDSLATFTGRAERLKKITRFSLYDVMLYRTNLLIHSSRVSWLVKEIEPYALGTFKEAYDAQKAYAIALVHDDAEMVTGDVQAGNKSKMTAEELAEVDRHEQEAIATLASEYPEYVGPYAYKDLLQEALDKNTLEAQVVMLGDKLDAFGETLHEIYAGNTQFVTNVVNEYGTIPTPHDYYVTYLMGFVKKYPAMAPLFQHQAWMFNPPHNQDFKNICAQGKPHTLQSLSLPTGYPHYDEWITVQNNYASKEELKFLHAQQEGM